mmetsp:Transcript_48384/g.122150  ORF Transcript_48384/g.122150 Transcript_48384/m.122150 type:complete len:249 (+) Transcript_48384:425-1171(+)
MSLGYLAIASSGGGGPTGYLLRLVVHLKALAHAGARLAPVRPCMLLRLLLERLGWLLLLLVLLVLVLALLVLMLLVLVLLRCRHRSKVRAGKALRHLRLVQPHQLLLAGAHHHRRVAARPRGRLPRLLLPGAASCRAGRLLHAQHLVAQRVVHLVLVLCLLQQRRDARPQVTVARRVLLMLRAQVDQLWVELGDLGVQPGDALLQVGRVLQLALPRALRRLAVGHDALGALGVAVVLAVAVLRVVVAA